jgi:hypothetical protein
MNFRFSRPDTTEPAADVADTEPDDTAEPTTAEVLAPDVQDVTPREDALDTPDAQNAYTPDGQDAYTPDGQNAYTPDGRDAETGDLAADTDLAQPNSQPRHAVQPGTSAFSTGLADDTLDGPLLADATQLQENWHQVQASFIDDPRSSVAEAAALVDHAAQALVGALQQRQRRLHESWDSASGETTDTDEESLDTEQLRIAMRRYRALFTYICQP